MFFLCFSGYSEVVGKFIVESAAYSYTSLVGLDGALGFSNTDILKL